MYNYLNRFGTYFLIILTASISLFSSSYAVGTENNFPTYPNSTEWNIDYLMAQNFNGVQVIFTNQTTTPFLSAFNSPTLNGMTGGVFAFIPEMRLSPVDTFIIQAHPGPSNNGGSSGWAMFFDLIAGTRNIDVTAMSTGSNAAALVSFNVEVTIRSGTALGGPVGSGPGSSWAGWTILDTVPVVQGSTSSGISQIFTLPTISVPAGDTVGVALRFFGAGPRYYGIGSPGYSTYSDTNLTLITGDARSAPFTPTGSWFASRALTGEIHYIIGAPVAISNTGSEIPDVYKLSQNYPNPFNPSTKIKFGIPLKSNVSIKVYNAHGRWVATLVNGEFQPGAYSIHWDASGLSSGVYFYKLEAGSFSESKKMILVK